MTRNSKAFAPAVLLMALVIGGLTLTCVQRAMAAITVPAASVFTFNLAAGATSGPINVAADRPVFVIGNSTTVGYRGTANMSVEHAAGSFIEWTGLNSVNGAGAPTITGGFTGTAGTHMLQLDYSSGGPGVFIQVAGPDTMSVANTTGHTSTGYVLLIF